MRISVRTGHGSSVSGGPAFWLIVGPFILAGFLAIGAYTIASMLVALIGGAISSRRGRPATPSEPLIVDPEDARPPGY